MSSARSAEPRVGKDLTVRSGKTELAAYVIEPAPALESPRPYWHPCRSRGGTVVSQLRPDDHTWHWGLSVAVANIDVEALDQDVNLWGGVTWVRGEGYRQLINNGSQRHEGWQRDAEGRVAQRLSWCTHDRQPFLAELRGVGAVSDGPHAWRLDVRSTWRNLTDGPLHFGSPTTRGRPDAGYGGFFLRASPLLLGSEVSLDGVVLDADQAQGRVGSTMSLTSATVRVQMTSSADNPVSPTPWFVRNAPVVMLCAAPFFHDVWTLEAGAEAAWAWGLTVQDLPPF